MSPLRDSAGRMLALMIKEFIQMRRDRLTFAMLVGIPVVQLLLFGFAINLDPKGLPTALALLDDGPEVRAITAGLSNSGYFALRVPVRSQAEGERLLATGDVQFLVTVPPGFSRALVRGERPTLLIEADATDPAAASNAIGAVQAVLDQALSPLLVGPLAARAPVAGPVELRVHRRYNPDGITQYNVVPGLMGVVLTMTMVMITALAVTRETERGTMEALLAMPVRPAEVMVGKVVPYIAMGYVQVGLILVASKVVFGVPMIGDLGLLSACVLLFIAANLGVGFTFSTVARNQLQAMQLAFFFFLPSILLSGFMFPFRGMPVWAQYIGEVLPLTHFLRVIRGILLKGNGPAEIWPDLWPIAAFLAGATVVALLRYRKTLD